MEPSPKFQLSTGHFTSGPNDRLHIGPVTTGAVPTRPKDDNMESHIQRNTKATSEARSNTNLNSRPNLDIQSKSNPKRPPIPERRHKLHLLITTSSNTNARALKHQHHSTPTYISPLILLSPSSPLSYNNLHLPRPRYPNANHNHNHNHKHSNLPLPSLRVQAISPPIPILPLLIQGGFTSLTPSPSSLHHAQFTFIRLLLTANPHSTAAKYTYRPVAPYFFIRTPNPCTLNPTHDFTNIKLNAYTKPKLLIQAHIPGCQYPVRPVLGTGQTPPANYHPIHNPNPYQRSSTSPSTSKPNLHQYLSDTFLSSASASRQRFSSSTSNPHTSRSSSLLSSVSPLPSSPHTSPSNTSSASLPPSHSSSHQHLLPSHAPSHPYPSSHSHSHPHPHLPSASPSNPHTSHPFPSPSLHSPSPLLRTSHSPPSYLSPSHSPSTPNIVVNDPDPNDTLRLIHLHSLLHSLHSPDYTIGLGTGMWRKELAGVFAWLSARDLEISLQQENREGVRYQENGEGGGDDGRIDADNGVGSQRLTRVEEEEAEEEKGEEEDVDLDMEDWECESDDRIEKRLRWGSIIVTEYEVEKQEEEKTGMRSLSQDSNMAAIINELMEFI